MIKISTILVAISVGLGIIIPPTTAQARPNIINGKPCVKEVCIGDNLFDLTAINWQPVDKLIIKERNRRIPNGVMLGNPMTIKPIAPYWYSGKIDAKGIKLLSRISGFCEASPNPLVGTYKSESGKQVFVNFELVGTQGGKTQEFIVSSISTVLPDTHNLTMNQWEMLRRDVDLKYPELLDRSPYNGLPYVTVGGMWDKSINLWSPPLRGLQTKDVLRNFPGCDGNRPIGID
jgi:hypothetical protein